MTIEKPPNIDHYRLTPSAANDVDERGRLRRRPSIAELMHGMAIDEQQQLHQLAVHTTDLQSFKVSN